MKQEDIRHAGELNLRPRDQLLKIPCSRQNRPKEKQTIFEQNEEFHVSTSQNPHFLPGTLYFSTFYLNDLAKKIFLLTRFEKNSQYSVIIKKRLVSGSVFHFLTRFVVKNKNKTVNFDIFLNHI